MRKKILSIVVSISMILSMIPMMSGVAYASGDTQPPVLDVSSISVQVIGKEGTTATAGDTVRVSMTITDDSNITSTTLYLYKPSNNSVGAGNLKRIENTDTFYADIEVKDYMESGIWKLYCINLNDENNNGVRYNNSDICSGTSVIDVNVDMSAVTFEIAGTHPDLEAPVINLSSLSVSKATAESGDTVTISVQITDNYDVKEANIWLRQPNGAMLVWLPMEYNEETGKYEYSITVDNDTLAGTWTVTSIRGYDYNSQYDDKSNSVEGLISFKVDTEGAEFNPPVIDKDSLKVTTPSEENSIVPLGSSASVEVEVSDDTEVSFVYFEYVQPENGINKTYQAKLKDDVYYADIENTATLQKGVWKLNRIYATDSYNNLAEIFNSNVSVKTPGADLSAGDFETIDVTDSGKCGTNLTWKYYKPSEELVISGEGAMTDYNSSTLKAPWYKYNSNIKKITVNEDVTYIGNFAFYNNYASEISLPNTLNKIGSYAFSTGNSTLKNFTLPDSVTELKNNAVNIRSLETINIGKVNTLGNDGYHFYGMNKLTQILTSESNLNYKSVDGVLFSKDGKTLVAFPKARKGNYTVPNGVEKIGNYAFYNVSLTGITFNQGLVEIGESAISCSYSLTSIDLPDSVETIAYNSFISCTHVKSIKIGAGLKEAGEGSFAGIQPDTVTVNENNTSFKVENGGLIGPKNTLMMYLPKADETVYEVPKGIEILDRGVFESNSNLKTVILPEGLKKIGVRAFAGSKINKIYIPTGITSVENFAFENNSITDIYYAGSNWNTSLNNTRALFTASASAKLICNHQHDLKYDGNKYVCDCGFSKNAIVAPEGLTKTYTGNTQRGIALGDGYIITGTATAKSAGKYNATLTLADPENTLWSDGTTDPKIVEWTIKKATPTVKITSTSKTVKYSSVKKKSIYTTALSVSGAKGSKSFKRVSGSSKLTISKTSGKILVKKGTKKGTYSIKVKVTSAATSNYNAKTSETKTIKVKVK